MATRSVSRNLGDRDETAVRGRILEAAFAAFTKGGYAATSTLEIATRARVSKRELYALIGNATHDSEHYVNIVTYLRMNKMVPPSSQPGQ